jgi:hypothetical protein
MSKTVSGLLGRVMNNSNNYSLIDGGMSASKKSMAVKYHGFHRN